MNLIVGDQIPSFSLKDQNGKMRSSNKLNKSLVLFFYPKDDTPGCTIEACGCRDKYDLFKILGAEVWGISNGSTQSHLGFANKNKTVVFGISKDSIESHLKFKKKYKLKFNLLSDEKKQVIKKYGVWGKKSFLGKEFMGIVRTTFLINSKGKIHKIWSNVRVKDHAKEVFEEIKNI